MANDRLLYDFAGLVTAPGRLARAEASCIIAKNLVFNAPGIVRKRNGFVKYSPIASGYPWKIFTSKVWGSSVLPQVLISEGVNTGAIQLQLGDGINPFATLATPDAQQVRGTISTRVQGAESLRSFYLAARDAPMRLEPDVTSSLSARYAGMPRGLPAGRGLPLVPGFSLLNGYARAFRVTWHRYDNDGVLLSGPPTSRWVVRNQAGTTGYTGGAADSQFYFPLPREFGTDATPITTAYFYRLWANRTFNAAAPANEEGDDEMYLVGEAYVTPADIAALGVTVTDRTPDDFLQRQLALNTNGVNFPLGELGIAQGIVNADDPPPVAYDVCSWSNVTWWADIRYRPSALLKFLSVGAAFGLQDNDTITVQIGATPLTLRAKLVPAAANDFQLYTGLATTQMNLEATAQAFAVVFNILTTGFNVGLFAYTVGLPTSMPGVVYFEASRIDPTGVGLQFASSRATWYQYDGSASGFGGTGGFGGEARNATCFSKQRRADAVPLVNRLTAGPNNARILRQVPYNDRLFLFTDAGVYVITGRTFADFAINPFALDLKLLAREAVAVVDDAVYAWCTQGIARITDGGWEIVSTAIEPTVQAAIAEGAANAPDGQTSALAFAVADSTNHRVMFWYPGTEVNTGDVRGCYAALVYDTRMKTWSSWQFDHLTPASLPEFRACGVARVQDGAILLGGEKTLAAAEGYLFHQDTGFFDSRAEPTGSDPVQSGLQLQFLIPDAAGAQHWQQTVLQWATAPSFLTIGFTTDRRYVERVISTSVDFGDTFLTRIEPPRDVRRANSFAIFLGSSDGAAFELVGVQQRYLSGSPWARGKAR